MTRHPTYTISWIPEGGAWIATCGELPDVSSIAADAVLALRGLIELVRQKVACAFDQAAQTPESIAYPAGPPISRLLSTDPQIRERDIEDVRRHVSQRFSKDVQSSSLLKPDQPS